MRLKDCPNAHPITIASKPDTINLNESADRGGAALTIILADVNALDHINAKAIPNIKTRSEFCLQNIKRSLIKRPFFKSLKLTY